MTRERFEYLFGQYKNDRLSQEEWDEMRTTIREGYHHTWLQNDFWQLMERNSIHDSWTPELEEEIWQQIIKDGDSKNKNKTLIRRIIRYSAVAASLLLVTGLAWFFRPVHPAAAAPMAAAPASRKEVVPGGNRAVLVLGDGRRIELDSAQNGEIARQGAATFNKSNGALSISFAGTGTKGGNHNLPGSASDNLHHAEGAGEAFISTPRGGQYQLILPDGSKVWLNSASSLRFPTVFSGKERSVELSGEGYFEIAKNAAMPFSVSVNHMKVRVLGTHFNTMAYPDEKTINTTLLEGAVEVSEGGLAKRLLPGQQAALNSADHQLAVGKADIQKTMAWKNGLFEFDHTDLAAIMRQLARWYDIEIVYKVTPDKTPLGGSISRNLDLEEVLNLLEENGINHFKIEGKKVVVLP